MTGSFLNSQQLWKAVLFLLAYGLYGTLAGAALEMRTCQF